MTSSDPTWPPDRWIAAAPYTIEQCNKETAVTWRNLSLSLSLSLTLSLSLSPSLSHTHTQRDISQHAVIPQDECCSGYCITVLCRNSKHVSHAWRLVVRAVYATYVIFLWEVLRHTSYFYEKFCDIRHISMRSSATYVIFLWEVLRHMSYFCEKCCDICHISMRSSATYVIFLWEVLRHTSYFYEQLY